MVEIIIDGNKIAVESGTTILEAARKIKIDIPTMCHLDGLEPFTSCMLCVVEDLNNGRLIPSCSMQVQAGMEIETHNPKVINARRDALELLLSEHVGDCEAPCRKGCPASMNIPLMIRQIENGELEQAIKTVKADIALPAVLGRICPAPCEKVCNRAKIDEPVSVCSLKRYSADNDLQSDSVYLPTCKPDSGKTVAIIGSGPTGLSAAYYLRQMGHNCIIYDKQEKPGGMLRNGVDRDILPIDVLDSEINIIQQLGARFILDTEIGKDITLDNLLETNDAIVIASGNIDKSSAKEFKVDHSEKGFITNLKTHESSITGIFVGGSAIRESKMAIRSCAHGKQIAINIDRFFNEIPLIDNSRFESRIGKLLKDDLDSLLSQGDTGKRVEIQQYKGFSNNEAVKEAKRCMHCDCRKPDTCKLRIYSDEYKADQKHYKSNERNPIEIIDQHANVVYEPGKCIKCGICVQITEKNSENLGLAFIGRGFDVKVKVPFDDDLGKALNKTAHECVISCPTAALSFKKDEI